jgi:hypothetical protein
MGWCRNIYVTTWQAFYTMAATRFLRDGTYCVTYKINALAPLLWCAIIMKMENADMFRNSLDAQLQKAHFMGDHISLNACLRGAINSFDWFRLCQRIADIIGFYLVCTDGFKKAVKLRS